MNIANNLLMFKKELWIRDYSLRMQRWLSGKSLPPIRIDAELHRRCNLKCTHCIRRCSKSDMTEDSKRIEVDDERWLEIARESGKMGVKSWNIAGIGEPMMKPDLTMKLMGVIKKYNMFGELTTNGTLWNEKHIKSVVDMGWDSVNVSIDGKDAQTHDSIRQVPGTFDKAAEMVRKLSAYRKESGKDAPCITINMVLNKLNCLQLPEMVRLTKDLGADAIFVEPMIVYGELGEKIRMDKKQVRQMPEAIKRAEALAQELDILTFISCMEGEDEMQKFNKNLIKKTGEIRKVIISNSKKVSAKKINPWGIDSSLAVEDILRIPCYYPWFYLMISADGSAVHCGECKEPNENIKNKRLKDIWYGDYMQKTREQFLSKELPQYCDRCRPNVIGDIRIVRKSIEEYADIKMLHNTLVSLMKENMALRDGKQKKERPKSRLELLKALFEKRPWYHGRPKDN